MIRFVAAVFLVIGIVLAVTAVLGLAGVIQ